MKKQKKIRLVVGVTNTVAIAFFAFLVASLSLIFSQRPLLETVFITGILCGVGFLFDWIYIYYKLAPYYKLLEEQARPNYEA